MGLTTTLAPEILVVEDHVPTARALQVYLETAGYRAHVTHSGNDAITLAGKLRPSGAVIDIHLPDLNGLVLAMKLRERLGEDVPLFVFSGDSSMETLKSLHHVGATYFLKKPINSDRLLEVVRQWIPLSTDEDPAGFNLEPA